MDMNVLKLQGSFRFYIRHPLKFFRHIFSSLKCARLRATQGWCPGDAWEMFMWLGTVIPDMLRYMADESMTFPGDGVFDEPSKWTDWLNSVADVLEYAVSEDDNENEYREEYNRIMHDKMSSIKDRIDIKDLYLKREYQISEAKQRSAEDALSQIGKHFFQLWD